MTQAQKDKHIVDRMPQQLTRMTELEAADPTPYGLGPWKGGRAELKSPTFGLKARPQRTADAKNAPGTDYASKITHRQDQDFNEIHTDANGDFWLYNRKTDAWDILGDSADIPYYEDSRGWRWGYNVRTGEWNVPVEEQEYI